ncbi:MAG: histidinol-phosphatase HisJ [Brevinematales bacterium]|nr:histidinol-phosphatase HisJ [Brevinematales bacterium]
MYNFHTHNELCDGEGPAEAYVLSAIEKDFKALGFSSHAPIPVELDWTLKKEKVDEYFSIIKNLKEKYKGKIELYLGLEFDYFEKKEFQDFYFNNKEKLDYNICSVHFFYEKNNFYIIDGKLENYIDALKILFNDNVISFVKKYYELIRKMIIEFKPDIIAHLDLIKKNNKKNTFFSEKELWYRKEILSTLDVIKKSSSLLEINTGGLARGSIEDFYPSEWLFKECYYREIPIIINSDCHNPSKLDAYFLEAKNALKKAGYSFQKVLINNKWVEVSF